jgi:hypothetical protein
MVVDLTPAGALALRMRSLLLPAVSEPSGVADVVEWFGAMQAQDLASVLWSLGARLPLYTEKSVIAALERREGLRTWPMRGTVHLIPPADAHWMLDLMGSRALAGAAQRRQVLGIDEKGAELAVDVLRGALEGGKRLTRGACVATLAEAGIGTAGQAAYHLLWYTSQRGVTCIAPNSGKEQTFVLLDEWAPKPNRPDRDEALAIMAVRYFRSHGPTTRKDFAGWMGMTATDAKRGIAAAGDTLTTVRVDGVEMHLPPELLDAPRDVEAGFRALPGFDEYLLGFKDRTLMVDDAHKQAIIPGGNGVFQATIVRSGRVIGTWKRTLASRARVVVDVQPLVPFRAADRKKAEAALAPYARYLDRELEVRW